MHAQFKSGVSIPGHFTVEERLLAIPGFPPDLVPSVSNILKPLAKKHARFCHGMQAAEDLEQYGLMIVCKTLSTFDGTKGKFEHYVKKALKNEIRREGHRLSRQKEGDLIRHQHYGLDEKTDPQIIINLHRQIIHARHKEKVTQKHVQDWVQELDQRSQQLYHLLHEQGHSQSETARVLNICQARVAQLKKQMEELGARTLAS